MRFATVNELFAAISPSRLRGYGAETEDAETVLARYLYNIRLSEALYPALQAFEVTLRNHVFETMTIHAGSPEWLNETANPLNLPDDQCQRMSQARRTLARRGKPVSPENLMGELSLGFWVSLFNSPQEQLWRKLLAPSIKAFPGLSGICGTECFTTSQSGTEATFRPCTRTA